MSEMNFASAVDNCFAHIFHDQRQFVGANVRMGFVKNFLGSAMKMKKLINALQVAFFLRARI